MTYMTEQEILQAAAAFTVGKVNGVYRVTLNQEEDRNTKVLSMKVGVEFHNDRTWKAPIPYDDWISFIKEAVAS